MEYTGETKAQIIDLIYTGELENWTQDDTSRVLEINLTEMTVEDITADIIGEVELLEDRDRVDDIVATREYKENQAHERSFSGPL